MKVVIHPKSEWELLPKAKDAGVGKLDGLRKAVEEVVDDVRSGDAQIDCDDEVDELAGETLSCSYGFAKSGSGLGNGVQDEACSVDKHVRFVVKRVIERTFCEDYLLNFFGADKEGLFDNFVGLDNLVQMFFDDDAGMGFFVDFDLKISVDLLRVLTKHMLVLPCKNGCEYATVNCMADEFLSCNKAKHVQELIRLLPEYKAFVDWYLSSRKEKAGA
jgi:hypothetical protein